MVTDGGAPNTRQRKDYMQCALRGHPVKTAVVTTVVKTNPIKRGIATAIHWINPEFRVFEPSDLLPPLEHIGVTRAQFDSIWTSLVDMQRTLPPTATLRLIGDELGLSVPERKVSSQRPKSRPPSG